VPIGMGTDGAGYDPGASDVFASNADGTFTVIHQDNPDTYRVLQTLTTPMASRNLGVDQMTHRVFVAAADFAAPAPPPGGAARGRGARPAVMPGTFKLLVIERQ